MSGATKAVDVSGVGVRIKGVPLLSEIDLSVEPGEFLAIVGPNGAGKSTLLRAITGAIQSTGTVRVCGHLISELKPRARAKLVSWVPQTPTIPAGITVFNYVLLGRSPHLHPLAREKRDDLAMAEQTIADLDLGHLADRMVETLSGGELQRCVIGRALAQNTPVILLDEPTSALDMGHQQEVLALLDRLRSSGERTIITTMHDLTLAGVFTDRLTMLSCGELVAEGAAVDVLTAANLEKYYGASVRITHENGQVLVTPRVERAMP